MNTTTRVLIHFFVKYKYFAIFPIAVAEGPIITIISGFLASRHVLSFLGAFLACFLGDLISDSFFYYIGRRGKNFVHKFKWLRVSDERIQRIEDQYEHSPWKTMIVAKVSYGLGIPFMLATGLSKMSFWKFLEFAGFLIGLLTILLMLIGYYFGRLAIKAGPQYIGYYTIAVIIIVPLIYLMVRKTKIEKRMEVVEDK